MLEMMFGDVMQILYPAYVSANLKKNHHFEKISLPCQFHLKHN
jgi:hypothetical protein